MKIIIVGGVAGGATTATRLRRLDEKTEIIIIDKGNHISFANCGLPYYIGNVIKNKEELLLHTPESFSNRFNIDVRVRQKVIKINKEEKKILIKKLENDEIYEEDYDKLILSLGAKPINPFEYIGSNRIRTLRTVEDAIGIKEYIENNDVKNVTIVGGGYIGVEMAENLRNFPNLNITIVQSGKHLINTIDEDMACFIHKEIRKHNINIILNNGVDEIEEEEKLEITLYNGEKITTDFIILCIGVKPEGSLALASGLTVELEKCGICVNEYMQTKNKDIYALGDVIQTINSVTGNHVYTSLAGPANRQARIVANNIAGKIAPYEGTIGSSIIKIFDYNLAMTGLNEKMCKYQQLPYKTIIISPNSHVGYYPGAEMINIKALYNQYNGQIYGAQVFGKKGVDKICDILAVAVKMKMTAYDLEKLELCYAPPFSSAKSPINILGNSIVNQIEKLVYTVTWEEVEDLKKREGVCILDVRTEKEFEEGAYENAINIPLEDLRNKLGKLEKSKKYLVYCRTGLRSYMACRILTQNGFKSVENITGGYYLYDILKES